MSERLKIGKQLEKSMTPWSVLITLDNNEGAYLPPGDNGQILTLNNGLINWADPLLEINGTPGYLARFDGLGTNIEDSKIFDNTPNTGYTDVRIYDDTTNGTYIGLYPKNDSTSFIAYINTPAVLAVANDTGGNYMYDFCTPTGRTIQQKGGYYRFRDTDNQHLITLAATRSVFSPTPPSYLSPYGHTSEDDSGISDWTWLNNDAADLYDMRSRYGLVSMFGTLSVSSHNIGALDVENPTDFVALDSWSVKGVLTLTTGDTLLSGYTYKIITYDAADDFTGATVLSGVINTNNCIMTMNGNYTILGSITSSAFYEQLSSSACISNSGTSMILSGTNGIDYVTSFEFLLDYDKTARTGNTVLQVFNDGIATTSGPIWDFGSGNNGAGVLGSPEDSTVTVVIDGTTYTWNALKS